MTTASPRARARAVVVAFALAAALVLAFPAAADDAIDWCDVASVPGAAFTDAWADFRWAG
jgi:hypothetical protein